MHELSLVQNVFNTLEEEFPDRIGSVRGIYLTVGILSNVQPLLMESAFNVFIEDQIRYKKMKLHVDVIPIIIKCNDCNKESEVEQYKFICRYCGKPTNNMIQGDEMLITKVEFEV